MRFTHEVIFSAAQKAFSDLLQTPTDQLEVSFPYERPSDITPFGVIFGPDVSFGKDRAVMSLPNTIMQRALPTSNATLRGLTKQSAPDCSPISLTPLVAQNGL